MLGCLSREGDVLHMDGTGLSRAESERTVREALLTSLGDFSEELVDLAGSQADGDLETARELLNKMIDIGVALDEIGWTYKRAQLRVLERADLGSQTGQQ